MTEPRTRTARFGVNRAGAALAGLLAAAAGLGAAQLLAGLLGVKNAPVTAVGAAFIDLVPGWLKELAIQLFGTADKAVLVAGILLVLAGIAAVAGLVGARSRPGGLALVVAFAALAAAASVTRPDAGVGDALPSVGAGVVAALALPALLRRLAPGQPVSPGHAPGRGDPDRFPPELDRRQALASSGVVVVGALAATGLGHAAGGGRADTEAARAKLRLPDPVSPRVPAGAELERAGLERAGLTPWRTPRGDFYRVDTALRVPAVDPRSWRLRVHGMVRQELNLSLHDLFRRHVVHRWVTLACVSNQVGGDLAGNALWSGLRLADVLEEAGVRSDADAVLSTSADGWTAATPLGALTDDRDSLLAFAMDGKPLPVEHGFPVRMVVPGLYGYVSATKWVTELEVTRFDRVQGYWTTRGWSARGPIKTASRIDVPRSGASVPAGRTAVAGVAWAQHRGIDRVEVRVDDGGWQVAKLAAEPTENAWRQWTWTWTAQPGSHRLQVRAVDGTGAVQTAREAPPAPNGASGWHTIDVTVT